MIYYLRETHINLIKNADIYIKNVKILNEI